MGVCYCTLAGTRACISCPNNQNNQFHDNFSFYRGWSDGFHRGMMRKQIADLQKAVDEMSKKLDKDDS